MEKYCRFAFPRCCFPFFYRLLIDSICHRGKPSLFSSHLQILINEETTRLSNALRASVYVETISIFFFATLKSLKCTSEKREVLRLRRHAQRFPRASQSRSSGKKSLPCGSAEKNYSRAVTRSSVNKLILPGQGCFAFFSLFLHSHSQSFAITSFEIAWWRKLENTLKVS